MAKIKKIFSYLQIPLMYLKNTVGELSDKIVHTVFGSKKSPCEIASFPATHAVHFI
jgi:hypothetical protein